MNTLQDYIKVFDNVIPKKLCDKIISTTKNSKIWTPTVVGKRGIIDKSVRNVDIISISKKQLQNQHPILKELDEELFKCSLSAIKHYKSNFKQLEISNDTGYDLLRYSQGCFYREHVDSFLQRPRTVSCSFILNDDYEGGEFAFLNRDIQIKPSAGSALMFPSNFMYPHEVMPVLSGSRYSIITWFV